MSVGNWLKFAYLVQAVSTRGDNSGEQLQRPSSTTVFSIHVPTSFLHGYSATLAAKLFVKLELRHELQQRLYHVFGVHQFSLFISSLGFDTLVACKRFYRATQLC